MSRAVIDSSVLLAYIRKEPHADKFLAPEIEVVVSTVNLAEIVAKLMLKGASEAEAWTDATGIADEVVPFSLEHARLTGSLIRQTRKYGLSLGDRACVALGLLLDLPVYTADRAWKDLQVGVEIFVVR